MFVWTPDYEKAFEIIKFKLATPPVLIFPYWLKPFLLKVDASKRTVGGTLSQFDDKCKILKPLGYLSATLEKSQ